MPALPRPRARSRTLRCARSHAPRRLGLDSSYGTILDSRWLFLANEQGSEDQRDRRKELHENVERRSGRVLERVTDRVADDGRGVGIGALAEDVAVVVLEVSRLDVLLGVVPRPAAVVEDRREQDARDGPDHQHAGDGLEAEDDADG